MLSRGTWVTITSVTNKVIRNMNVEPRPCTLKDFKNTTITIKSMDIELLNADTNPSDHQASRHR